MHGAALLRLSRSGNTRRIGFLSSLQGRIFHVMSRPSFLERCDGLNRLAVGDEAQVSTAAEMRLERLWETPHNLWGKLTTVDHKEIGRRYLVTAMAFLVVGGLEALAMRLQLAGPNG